MEFRNIIRENVECWQDEQREKKLVKHKAEEVHQNGQVFAVIT